MNEPTIVELMGYRFTYYPISGGIVVTRYGRPIDAAADVRRPEEPITAVELERWGMGWITDPRTIAAGALELERTRRRERHRVWKRVWREKTGN